jgi:hypothetical protein
MITKPYGWRAALREHRRLKAQATELVNANWMAIRVVARALSIRRVLQTREEIVALLEGHRIRAIEVSQPPAM